MTPSISADLALPDQSILTFDRSQQLFFRDRARIQAANWHRQKGKDFTAAAKAVDGAMTDGDAWFIISLTQRQADETFAKCRRVADAMRRVYSRLGEYSLGSSEFEEHDKWLKHTFTWNAHEIRFPNGGRVVSLPGRDPDTCAGYSGNLILTEFGLFPRGGYDHWSVIFPIITRSGRYRLIMISTPRAKNTKFYEVVQNEKGKYSIHFCDIYKSVFEEGYQLFDEDGQPFPQSTRAEQEAAIAGFRAIYADEAKWPREYECQFTGDLEALLKYGQLQHAAELGRSLPFSFHRIEGDNVAGWNASWFDQEDFKRGGGRLEIGWDVARVGDLSSVWCNHARPGQPKHLRFLVVMHRTSFALQRDVIRAAMKAGGRTNVGAGDATGLGMDSNETMAAEFGASRWLPFNFSGKGKAELGSIAATTYDAGGQTIPAMEGEHKYIATDLGAIEADRSGGTLKLSEGENPLLPESHCDIAYSNFLSLRAGALAGQTGGLLVL